VNRAITTTADGGFVLRPGRHYRMLCVVNGPTTCDDLEATLAATGFQDVAATAPQDWASERPGEPDPWPMEPLVATAANEALVRVKGAFFGSGAESFDRDRPIDSGEATYTIAAAWDCGPATRKRAMATTTGKEEVTREGSDTQKLLIALGVGTLVVGGISLHRANKREARDEEALARLEQKRLRSEFDERIAKYLAGGATRCEAERMAERSMAAEEARRLADALEKGDEVT